MNQEYETKAGFTRIYEKYAPMVYRRCLFLLKDENDASDLTQDVFLRIYTGRARLDLNSPSSLFWNTATHLALNRIRDKKRHGTVTSSEDLLLQIANKAKGPQVGLFNYCTSCKTTPVGILNIVGNGVWALTAGIDEMGGTNLNAKFGTAIFYTQFEMGRVLKRDNLFEYQDLSLNGMGFGTQFGQYGTHLGLDYTFLINAPKLQDNFEFDTEREDASAFHHRLRLYGTAKLFTGFGITSGISMNVVTEGYSDGIVQEPRGEWHGNYTIGGRDVRIWPGFFAGFTLGRF